MIIANELETVMQSTSLKLVDSHRQGPKTIVERGDRYNGKMDVADVAKLIRKDIREAKKAGELDKGLKTSVRIERFSMGQSITITAQSPKNQELHDQLLAIGKRYRLRKTHDQPDDYHFCNFFLHVYLRGSK